ncbi:hypothetical protein BB561_003448, partial [Smittium simulii]
MIFHKSLLSACFLAHALLQTSVYADEPRTKVQAYDAPAVTHSANGAVTVCDKNGCVTTLDENKNNDSKYPEINDEKNNYSYKCKNGEQKCASGKNGIEECVNGKIVFTDCKVGGKCSALSENKAECVPFFYVPDCKNGEQKCASGKNGVEECVNGKIVFTDCKVGGKCSALSENKAEC